jgi:hypothetical protein
VRQQSSASRAFDIAISKRAAQFRAIESNSLLIRSVRKGTGEADLNLLDLGPHAEMKVILMKKKGGNEDVRSGDERRVG